MADESVETPTHPSLSTRLPSPTSSFIGRQAELDDILALVRAGARLVTLTGSGGSGKTRLAIEAAAGLALEFAGEVHWLSLAVIRDPRLVMPTLADALGAREELAVTIADNRMLVLLDNFEQVVSAAPELAALLEVCPNLYVLVTSRELLSVPGETEYAVSPLASGDAVALFCARSRLAADDNIHELCRRLDNLPLALELAAARTRVLSPGQILSRLSDRLDLFHAGRGAEPRQRTLRAAIEWSCQLLEPADLTLFTRLGAFAGGCTIEAAQQVTAADVDGLQSLVDKNLLRHTGERFWMLETIREYAVELLAVDRDEEQVRARHADWCIGFLEVSERLLVQGRAEAVQEMEQEFGNIRSAFHWCIETGRIAEALRLVRPRVFWQSVQMHAVEGREWMETVLARSQDVEPALRTRVLATAGDLLRVAADLDGARVVLEEALAIDLASGNDAGLGGTSYALGRVELSAGNYERADEVTRAGLAAARATNDTHAVCELSAQIADVTYRLGDRAAATAEAEEALRITRAAHDMHSEGDALRVLAMTARDGGDLDRARALLAAALAIMRQLSDNYCMSQSLAVLGDVELLAGRPGAARAAFTEALELQRMIGQWRLAVDSLWGVAAADVSAGQTARAAVLLAAEAALRVETEACLLVTSGDRHAAVYEAVEQRVTNSVLSDARARGSSMSRDEAVGFALAVEEAPADMAPSLSAPPGVNVIRREGEYWTVRFDGTAFRLKDGKGLRYLAALLRSPGREFHVLDLVRVGLGDGAAVGEGASGADGTALGAFGDAGPLLDQHAKVAYRARLGELEEDLAEATSWADTARSEKIRDEIDFLTNELTGSMGLGGRDRRSASAAERARVNVTRSVWSVVRRIATHDSTLAHHLDATVHTGTFCSYTPDPRQPTTWGS